MRGLIPWLLSLFFGDKVRCYKGFCDGRADPRCGGMLCTSHCVSESVGCGGICIVASFWESSKEGLKKFGHADPKVLSNGATAVIFCSDCGLTMPMHKEEGWVVDATNSMKAVVSCDSHLCKKIMDD